MQPTSPANLDLNEFDNLVEKIKGLVDTSVRDGVAVHVIEQQLLEKLLQLGHAALHVIFQSLGQGDVGPTLAHPEHKQSLKRFPALSTRHYRSIFGDFELSRFVYGRTITQKVFAIPFDEHLGLPPQSYSLLLESWVTQLATSEPIHEGLDKLRRIFGISVAVDSAERILDRVGANAEYFQDNLPPVEVADEGELLVESTDNKGIVMRRKATTEKPPVGAPTNRIGPVPDRKQMATVSGCYSIDRFIRSPEEVLQALFRENQLDDKPIQRPRPKQSRYQACLTRSQDHPDDTLDGEVSAIHWLSNHVQERRREGQELINLNDGERSIWSNVEFFQGQNGRVDIIDLIHVIQRVWDAGAILKANDLTSFAKEHIGSILKGNVKRVIQSFRWQTTKKELHGQQASAMATICGFFERNANKMQYNEYLAKGYPISSGFIEGACRHVVKDRMERSGMRWSVPGAQNMLFLRCINAARLWESFIPVHQTRTLSNYGTRKNYLESFQTAA